jgi:hypothetical protein
MEILDLKLGGIPLWVVVIICWLAYGAKRLYAGYGGHRAFCSRGTSSARG